MNLRKIEEQFFRVCMICATIAIMVCLVIILATILVKGIPALSLSMITQTPKGGFYLGKEGGILNAILGSLLLSAGATFIALLVSIPVVLYLNIYVSRKSKFAAFTRFSCDVLWGVPSIVYGAFGFILMLYWGMQSSLLGGIIAVALLIIPIMSRAMDEVVRMVPAELLETSYALGATRLETAVKVMLRQTLPGVITAVLIAFGRGIGDAASVIFTAGFTDALPGSLFRPTATLPLAIFFQLGTPFPKVQDRAYAAAVILTLLILAISVVSRILMKRFTRHRIR